MLVSDYRTAGSIGERVKSLRKRRGLKSPQDLLDLMPGSKITVATIENLEAGRREELGVSQLLNIAFALGTTPSFLLAPIGYPSGPMDLANLIPGLKSLTVAEFDSWLSGNIDGAYRWGTLDELNDRNQLSALRGLLQARNELRRLLAIEALESESEIIAPTRSAFADQVRATEKQIETLVRFLRSAGWSYDDI